MKTRAALLVVLFVLALSAAGAAPSPAVTEGDFVLRDFRFEDGEVLPALSLHYATLGRPERDASGVVRNAVLILHGTGGSKDYPTRGTADRFLEEQRTARVARTDANDFLRGHGTHSLPEVWKDHLAALLSESETGVPAAGGGSASAATASGKAAAAPSAAPDDAARVEALERELVVAIGRGDLDTYARIVADDYVAQDAAGKSITREQAMASYRTGARRYRDLTIHDVAARVYGDTAVVTARTEGFRVEDGREEPNRVRYVRVYARRQGTWRAVAQMAARSPEPQP